MREKPRFPYFFVATIIFLVGFQCILAVKTERPRWHLAAAFESYLDNNLSAAIDHLSRTIEATPDDISLLTTRARWHRLSGDAKAALLDSDRVVKVRADTNFQARQAALLNRLKSQNATTEEVETIYSQLRRDQLASYERTTALQCLGQHEEAIDIAGERVRRAKDEHASSKAQPVTLHSLYVRSWYASTLNGRAYIRALANCELDEALVDIEKAFELQGSEDDDAKLDTRGYLYYLTGDIERAKSDMEMAVAIAERRFHQNQRRIERDMNLLVDDRSLRVEDKEYREHMSVLYHHRGLVYKALGEKKKAEQDLERAKDFGYNPNKGIW